MGEKKEKKRIKPKKTTISTSVTPKIYRRIERDAREKDQSIMEHVRNIIDEHYSVVQDKTLKDLAKKVAFLIPDFKSQQITMTEFMEAMNEYVSQSTETHEYVAEMKSAESFNMKKSREYYEEIKDMLIQLSKSGRIKAVDETVSKPTSNKSGVEKKETPEKVTINIDDESGLPSDEKIKEMMGF